MYYLFIVHSFRIRAKLCVRLSSVRDFSIATIVQSKPENIRISLD